MHKQAYALLLSYDGAPFKGFQPQPGIPTVCGSLVHALRKAGVGAHPWGASRTDAGVHARAQVATFHSHADLDPEALRAALNAALPDTIRVRALRKVAKSTHAHWSSVGKVYRYRVSTRPEPASTLVPHERLAISALDEAKLTHALAQIAAAPDLKNFTLKADKSRTIRRAEIVAFDPSGATLEIEGEAFGRYMVRYLAALALSHAGGLLDVAGLAHALSGEEKRPGRAPPEGLTLWRVLFAPEADPFPDTDALLASTEPPRFSALPAPLAG